MVKYDVPVGWIEEYNGESDNMALKTPDYEQTNSVSPIVTNGARIILGTAELKGELLTAEDVYTNSKVIITSPEKMEDTTAAGMKAIMYYSGYEGYRVTTMFDDGQRTLWSVVLTCENCQTKDQFLTSDYYELYHEFLQSIKLIQD